MKTLRQTSFPYLTYLLFFITLSTKAQQPSAQIAIKTSAVCEMCKKNIEKALTIKEVEKSNLDLKTQIVTVSYNAEQTSPEQIKTTISKAGYDADELKANPEAYKRLQKCCKKPTIYP